MTEYSLESSKTEVVDPQGEVTTPPEAPPTTPTTLEVMIKAILKALYEAKRPLAPAEIRQITGCTPTQFHKAIQFLKGNGEVTMVGKHPRPAYRVAEVAPVRKSSDAVDANEQVVLALRDTPGMGGTMTIGEIKGATKLSDEQVRRALHDLLAAGRITREGRSANRRYGLAVVD